jgi:hypothetical protein
MIPAFLILAICLQTTPQLEDFDFLIGKWKRVDKEQYEEWTRGNGVLVGKGYRIKEGKTMIFEYLRIFQRGGDVIYEAIVPDQNEGSGIEFKLMKRANIYSFENPEHDFPKRIIYEKPVDNKMTVQVRGAGEDGFDVLLEKVD